MISAKEAKGKTMAVLRNEEQRKEKLFEGFLEYAGGRVELSLLDGKKSVKILCDEFNPSLKYTKVPASIISEISALGYAISDYCDFEDGNGIVIKWMD